VKAGDQVKSGQLLARIDTRLVTQQAMTNQAQVAAARAQLSAARQEYERKKRLYEKQYISQAAFERAESDYKTAEARTNAELAQTGMASVQTGLHTINAPYAGIIADVMAEQGDMAMPGKPLLSLYDPKELRVVVNVPQSQIASIRNEAGIKVLIPAAAEAERNLTAGRSASCLLLTWSAIWSRCVSRCRRIWPVSAPACLHAPCCGYRCRQAGTDLCAGNSVIKRSELVAVYIVDSQGLPHLRQVRLGRTQGENVEVFAGLQAGEKVAVDPIAAANFKNKKLLKK